MSKYDEITQEDFDRVLEKIVRENISSILLIGDVYSELAEYFNNDVLEKWEEENS